LQWHLDEVFVKINGETHVGDLNHCAGLLKRITDSAFSEGEFAE